jgi:hypothetical protein
MLNNMTTLYNTERTHRPLEAKGLCFEPSWKQVDSEGTTRSNTPDSAHHHENHSSDSGSDKEDNHEISTPEKQNNKCNEYCGFSDFMDLSSFEIDVCPKRKRFNNPEERKQFVDDYRRKFKTELCKNWELRGQCKFGDKCCFAHGKHELKSKTFSHMKYKTKPCKQYYQTGYCPYGMRCQYLHREALQPNILFNGKNLELPNYDIIYEKLHQINTLSSTSSTLLEVLSVMPVRSRLTVFAAIKL